MSDWIESNARGYLTFRFNAKKFKADIKAECDAIWKGVKSDLKLYKQLLEILGEEYNDFVPYDTGQLARFYTDSKNGLMYRRFNPKDGFNVAEWQYNVEYPERHYHKKYGYIYERKYKDKNGKEHTYAQIIKGKGEVHPLARDHWADAEVTALIWDDFVQKAAPLIIKSAKKRGKK